MFAAIILASALGVCVFWVFGILGNLATRSWRTTGGSTN
jgi:ABC-type nitrate/sulfonate/bicarbonate transport system permease component